MPTTSEKRPAFQFYPKDWMTDLDLMTCSPAAHGLWIYMLCLMHFCEPYGHLTMKDGSRMLMGRLAKLYRVSVEECRALLCELEEGEVFSVTDDGIIYSRRMVADGRKHEQRLNAASKGGRTKAAKHPAKHPAEHPAEHPAGTPAKPLPDDVPKPLPKSCPSTSTSTSSSISSSCSSHMVDSDEIDRACFDDIWKLVPKGRKVAKEEARRLWDGKKNTNAGVRITAEETHLILERYPLHVEMWKRDATPTGKIPHLRTWLNQSRWVDEIEGEDVTDDGTWLYDTYRATCFADHGDDPDWECYADWAAKFEPCTAPTFNDFKKGDANG